MSNITRAVQPNMSTIGNARFSIVASVGLLDLHKSGALLYIDASAAGAATDASAAAGAAADASAAAGAAADTSAAAGAAAPAAATGASAVSEGAEEVVGPGGHAQAGGGASQWFTSSAAAGALAGLCTGLAASCAVAREAVAWRWWWMVDSGWWMVDGG
eukprot:CAMPEP_0181225596 /NCGR_PEP_ID=MMETSP1096-20121128/31788_1 /TAXON_ID=156174 ORGANISM="Chrysochromulina ericina, Strain CCMP281" /NCGR_SAMPLE_ID=MMETSP1096 /ASSEMBLY_ACC=CAM_ASM_000453 /LENGTH=158 /DNA_ID=CAMNT_0023318843 /DNA_START=185 /DNA_END=661 /DNA_ORIENTATION=-